MGPTEELKVVSWNADCNNGDPRQIQSLIEDEDPDVLCLQEVSEALKKQIESPFITELYPYSTFATDHQMDGPLGLFDRTPAYLLILSKRPFEGTPFRYTHKRVRDRILLARLRGWHECIEHHGVDISVQGTVIRILNVHIACADTFRNKKKQLGRVIRHFNTNGLNVVCGDFNITTEPKPKYFARYLFRWLLRTHSIQELLQGNERKKFSKIVKKVGICDMFCNHITHPASGLSLDKILISARLTDDLDFRMSEKMYGSDHFPLVIKFGQKT